MTQAESTAKAWRCAVCGYVHRGETPPDWCPVCGAAGADFQPYSEPAAPAEPAPSSWRCLNCSHVHVGPAPPEVCPVCGAPQDRFEPVTAASPAAGASDQAPRVLIVGAGIAGVAAAEALREASSGAEITILSKETHLPYYRLNLTRLLAGEIDEDALPIHPAPWYGENRIELRAGVEVKGISLDHRSVELLGGEKLPYEKLILTVGAHPFIPPLAGSQREGVASLRTLADARVILDSLRPGMKCACVGGGLLGLEAAAALARRGAEVTLLESHGWPMPRQLNATAGGILAEHLAAVGVRLRTNVRTKEIVGDERVSGVLLEDGATVPADLVVVATGVRPNSHLARRAGLEVNKGIVVNNHLVSSDGNVLAAGDVAEHHGVLYGAWAPSQFQGAVAGLNAGGGASEFGGLPRSNALKVLGIDLMSMGQFEPEDGSFDVVEDQAEQWYHRFVFHDGRLVGAILLGDASAGGAIRKAMESGRDFSALLQSRPSVAAVTEAAGA